MPEQPNGRTPHHKVAIVVPMSNRAELLPDEEISLRHLTHYLGKYDKFFIVPEGLAIDRPGFGLARFAPPFFGSVQAYTRLMLSRALYQRFGDYEFMLVYHLDALVFADELEQWCASGYDYIGPPWLVTDDTPWVKTPRVGNGGFCLRRISRCLQVLESPRYAVEPEEYWQRYKAKTPDRLTQIANYPRKYLKRLHPFNSVQREVDHFNSNEDKFWSFRARHYVPEFKIAPVAEALRFGFEGSPRTCFAKNNYQLPFGCHAWPKYDRAFWEPHLLQEAAE